jgi:hypothetical protein
MFPFFWQSSDPDPFPSFSVSHILEKKNLFTAMPVYIVLSFSSVSKVITLFFILDSYWNLAENLVFSLR